MNEEVAHADSSDSRPSQPNRCGECGESIRGGWVSYRRNPDDPKGLIHHFGGVIRTTGIEPPERMPTLPPRDFRDPDDVGAVFHSLCAPRVEVLERIQDEIAKLFTHLIFADWEQTVARWSRVRPSELGNSDPLRCRAHVASCEGRRVFTVARAEWKRLRTHEGQVLEMEVERAQAGGMAEAASRIGCLAAKCPVESERIEVWRYKEDDRPTLRTIQRYLVFDNLPRRPNLPMFAERTGTEDSPELRKHLRDHVFIVKEHPDKAHWEPKSRFERLVFLGV
jgi:hypothetical protein